MVRGNSPTGVLWRLEGVPIPNPNHFSTLGTTGGPVSALNTNLLKNSDFITSAFPAEYGNALSGVFDVGFRSGNKDKYEFTAQLSAFSGFEGMAEGPIKGTKGGSFLVSYRHAFTSVAGNLGLDIGTNAIPNYRDLSFKVDFGQTALGRFQVFGIAAASDIDFLAGEVDGEDLFAEPDTDALPRSNFGVVGVKHNKILSSKSYIKTVISGSLARNTFTEFRYVDTTLTAGYDYTDVEDDINRLAITSYYNLKSSARLTTRVGVTAEQQSLVSLVNSREGNPDNDNDGIPDWQTVRDVDDNLIIVQPFIHAKYKLTERLTLNAGLHGQYLNLNGQSIIEPRGSLNYTLGEKSSLTLGYGLHSQVQPLPTFFYQVIDPTSGIASAPNTELDFTKAHHFVAGYEVRPADQWRVKTEVYYQHIFDVPVDPTTSTFSMLNAGADFVFPEVGRLVNEGTGRNYGAELTVEKFFSDGYYALLTGSLFQSRYTASDGVERNTAFNNEMVLNVLIGKEWRISDRLSFTADTRVSTADGRYYTPVDLDASRLAGIEVLDNSQAFSLQQDPYFRWDVKLGIRTNNKRGFSQLFALDFQNVTDRENIFANRYNRVTNEVNRVNQAGFFPDILYRIQF